MPHRHAALPRTGCGNERLQAGESCEREECAVERQTEKDRVKTGGAILISPGRAAVPEKSQIKPSSSTAVAR
jgi:hypothetical protein